MTLPKRVVEQDQRLQRAADELMKLRWHWTLNEENPERVAIREYARQVGRDHKAILRDAHAWADWLHSQSGDDVVPTPGAPQTPGDFRELSKLNTDRQEAAKAVAAASGASVSNVASHKRDEVDAVLNTAQSRAAERGTTVEHEIPRAAEWREKARKAAARQKDERRKRSTLRFVEIEGHIGAATQRLRKILDSSQDVEFTDEERELLVSSISNLRQMLNLIDLRIAGETQIDWDAELERLVK